MNLDCYFKLKQSSFAILEGKQVLLNYLKDGHKVDEILLTRENYQYIEKYVKDTSLIYIDKKTVKNITGMRYHQGIWGKIKKPTFFHHSELKGPKILLQGITSPENMGTILRSCYLFGLSNILLLDTLDPYLKRVIRVSLGYSLNLHFAKITLKELLNYEVPIIATTCKQGTPLLSYVFPRDYILCFGSEGSGLPDSVLNNSDLLTIPTVNKGSLNVAMSATTIMCAASQYSLPMS